MKFRLNILERIALLNILPMEGNVATLKIMRELQGKLSFSEAEMKQFNMKVNKAKDGAQDYLTWDSGFSTVTKDIEIGNTMKDIIIEQLKNLELRKKLRMEMLDLYDKFIVGKPQD